MKNALFLRIWERLNINFLKIFINKVREKRLDALYLGIIITTFLIRVINLNYNSAFNDEGIYIVVGRMGLFENDWSSYGANFWMAGLPYIYPPLSALAFQTGGLIGSRLLNIFFGVFLVEEIYRLTRLINLFDKKTNQVAGILAAFFAGFSGVGIFVSNLATYDILSFLLFVFALNSFLKSKDTNNGKYYFLSSIALLLAFFTKIIIAIFFPITFIVFLYILKNKSFKQKRIAVIYLLIPFLIGISLYLFFYFDNLSVYIATHRNLGKAKALETIFQEIINIVGLALISAIPSFLILIRYRKIKEVMILLIFALATPIFHLFLKREQTLNKHLYLTVVSLSILIGYGFSVLILNEKRLVKLLSSLTLIILMFLYFMDSQKTLIRLQKQWLDSTSLQEFLRYNVKPGNKILTENGGAVILALYDITFPPENITTFDWIDYSNLNDESGYIQAVKDKYFDYIELNNQYPGKESLRENIRKEMIGNYLLVYKKDDFEVYRLNNNLF